MYYIHVKCVAESDLSEIGHQGVKFRTDLLTVPIHLSVYTFICNSLAYDYDDILGAQSSQSIFAQKYLCNFKDTYSILQNKYLHIYEDFSR